jgi:hypothetical protein
MRLLLCAAAAGLSVSALADTTTTKGQVSMGDCIVQLSIQRNTNPWKQWDAALGSAGDEPVTAVPVADLAAGGYGPVAALSRFAVKGSPLMGVKAASGELAVSKAVFSALSRADATKIEPGDSVVVGALLERSGKALSLRDVVLFLLESRVVATYQHMESQVCLKSEKDGKERYCAHFTGTHVYFTNERHVEPLDFSLAIDKRTGAITLAGPEKQ